MPYFWERYSSQPAPSSLVKLIRRVDQKLDLKFHWASNKWHVVRYLSDKPSQYGHFTKILTIEEDIENGKRGYLGTWLYDYLKRCDTQQRDLLAIQEQEEEQKAKSDKEEFSNVAHEMAKDLRKPLLSAIDGIESTKTVWQVGG